MKKQLLKGLFYIALGYLLESMSWASNLYLLWLGIAFVGLSCVVLILLIIEKSKIFLQTQNVKLEDS